MLRISELRNKDVIDCRDGKRLGYISDIEIDVSRGGVESIIIPAEGRFFTLFNKNTENIIPWRQIKKIGVDVILIEPEHAAPPEKTEKPPEKLDQPDSPYNVMSPEAADEDTDFFSY